MKINICLLFGLNYLFQICFSQTFRSGFDLRDWNSTGRQGLSFHSNANANLKSDMNNIERSFLRQQMNILPELADNALSDSLAKNHLQILVSFHGALNFAFPTYYDSPDGRPLMRYGAGFMINFIPKGSKISLATGISYSDLEYTFDGASYNRVDFFKFSLLNIPVSFQYNFFDSKRLVPFLCLGGQLSLLITNSYISYRPFLYITELYKNDSLIGFASVGCGVEYELFKKTKLYFQTSFYQAVTPLKYEYINTIGVEKIDLNFLRYMTVSIGAKIKII